jgi:hypothetical protein
MSFDVPAFLKTLLLGLLGAIVFAAILLGFAIGYFLK